jgi:hypothetical protein
MRWIPQEPTSSAEPAIRKSAKLTHAPQQSYIYCIFPRPRLRLIWQTRIV